MKNLILCFFFCFLSFNHYGGCGAPRFTSNFGIYTFYSGPYSHTASVNQSDSFLVTINGGNCYNLSSVTASVNGRVIHSCSDHKCQLELPSIPGDYYITAINSSYYTSHWLIKLLPAPQLPDTTPVVPLPDTLPISPLLNNDFLVYPNPAINEITLLNETEEIKAIALYDFYGKLLKTMEGGFTKITFPINDLPVGIYFVQVATINEKILIKKFLVR